MLTKNKAPLRSALWRDFRLLPIEDNFAGSPAAHDVEAFLEVVHFEVVSDNWADIETRLDQARHLIPSFKHLTAVDAFDHQTFEDHLVPINRHG